MAPSWTLINGRFSDVVPATDRGLQYGDGLFETMAVHAGRPCLWQRHLNRLALGCERLGIPEPDSATLAAEADGLLVEAAADEGVLKLILTRGSGPRGYAPPPTPQPTRILSFHADRPATSQGTEAGVWLTLCETRLGENPRLAGIKHLNRLEQVLARAEWFEREILDGVMCDTSGQVICGTMSNIYVVDGGGIRTPSVQRCGVAGTVREVVRDAAEALGIPFAEGPLRIADLLGADALCISNALLGLVPVARLRERRYDPAAAPSALIEQVRQTALQPETSA